MIDEKQYLFFLHLLELRLDVINHLLLMIKLYCRFYSHLHIHELEMKPLVD